MPYSKLKCYHKVYFLGGEKGKNLYFGCIFNGVLHFFDSCVMTMKFLHSSNIKCLMQNVSAHFLFLSFLVNLMISK